MKRGDKVVMIQGLDKPVMQLSGEPFNKEIGVPLTLGDALFEIAKRPIKDQSSEEKLDAYGIMKKLRIPCAEVELEQGEIDLLKKILAETAPTEFYGVMSDILDNGGIA